MQSQMKSGKQRMNVREPMEGTKLECRLRALRSEEGMSANVLARDARLTAKTVLRIETGVEEPSVLVALRIAEAVGLEVEDIFSLRADRDGGDVD